MINLEDRCMEELIEHYGERYTILYGILDKSSSVIYYLLIKSGKRVELVSIYQLGNGFGLEVEYSVPIEELQ